MSGIQVSLYVAMATVVIEASVVFYASMRNDWVAKERAKLRLVDYDLYLFLPSYWTMLNQKFWCWDINGFLPPNFKGGHDGKNANS